MKFQHILDFYSLRGRIRLYAFIGTSIPVIITILFFTFFQRDQIIENEKMRISELLKQKSITIQSFIDERFTDVSYLALLPNTFDSSLNTIHKSYYDYVATHPGISSAVYINAEGYGAIDTSGHTGMFGGDRLYFKEAQAGRKAVSTGILGRVSGKQICIFSCPVMTEKGEFNGVVFVSMQIDVLDAWMRGLFDSDRQKMLLCDAEGRILASIPETPATPEGPETIIAPALMHLSESGQAYTDKSGKHMLGASVQIGQTGWRLIGCLPEDAALAGYRWQMICMAMGTIIATLLMAPLILRFCKNIEKPLELLTAYALELRKNNYAAPTPLSDRLPMPKEFHILFEAFGEMGQRVTKQINEAEEASQHDVLTGLHNRRYLLEASTNILGDTSRAGQPCACLILDLDHFKRINDSFGHTAGDNVLQHAAQTIRNCARQSDLLVRYGGEEFVILAPDVDSGQAEHLAQRIRKAMGSNGCMINGQRVTVTVSIGVAIVRKHIEYGKTPLDDMLARADKALYRAKETGRNKVVVAS